MKKPVKAEHLGNVAHDQRQCLGGHAHRARVFAHGVGKAIGDQWRQDSAALRRHGACKVVCGVDIQPQRQMAAVRLHQAQWHNDRQLAVDGGKFVAGEL